ncbi:LysR family transcriptional regulator [Dyella amyloliquefaciens]|uniref:LysR family transcriptional regulator n=1 Tax=Dyella amyloliquefaciens TaxID=1770545 RepID=UPI00102EC7DD|nr:LysR family transcriptional regulator [Dyella amyloliquefaciens]
MHISLRHLRAFISVATTGSFTRAASALFVTQSALTKTIRELEDDISLALFERTTRRVSLTTHGQSLYPIAERLVKDFDKSMLDLRERCNGGSGTVNIACGLAFASSVLPEVARVLNARHPDIRLNILDNTSGGVVKLIDDGEMDLGFGSYVGAAKNLLGIRKILTARLGVLFPPDYPVPTKLGHDELVKLPILSDSDDSSIADTLNRQMPELWGELDKKLVVTNLDLQLCFVRKSVGVCIVSALAASHPYARGLPFKLIDDPNLAREIFVFTRKTLPISPAAATFLSVMDEVLANIDFLEGVVLHQ